MDGRVTTLLSIALLVVFAYLSSHFPQYLWSFFVAYLIVALAVALLAGARAASALARDLERVRRGKVLLVVSREEVERLRARDKELSSELSRQTLASIPQAVVLAAFFAITLVPALRDSIIGSLEAAIASAPPAAGIDAPTLRFLTFLAFYGLLAAAFQAASLYSRRALERAGGRLEVPSYYAVTEDGLLLEGRLPLKAPLQIVDLKVDTRRRFVEIRARLSGVASRYRLYHDDPRELKSILERLAEERR